MINQHETIDELVESLKSLSDFDLQFVSRIVHALGKTESEEALGPFEEWAIELAHQKGFADMTEEPVAQVVHEYRQAN